jgi:hypothetical protein
MEKIILFKSGKCRLYFSIEAREDIKLIDYIQDGDIGHAYTYLRRKIKIDDIKNMYVATKPDIPFRIHQKLKNISVCASCRVDIDKYECCNKMLAEIEIQTDPDGEQITIL